MPVATQPPETDLLLPRPEPDQHWEGLTIHTHYFGFAVPEENLSAFVYIRYQPVYGLSYGGVCLFRGMNNLRPLDCEHIDFRNTMPWPKIEGNSITTENGLTVAFPVPGEQAKLTYESLDGSVGFELVQDAVTPLLVRGHVMPGEDLDSDPAASPGGSEQFMHCTGELNLHGKTYAVDCHPIRDRSWRQVRTEAPSNYPPAAWTPMHFGPDLIFNQVGFEVPDNAVWKGAFELPEGAPLHYFGFIVAEGESRQLATVRRTVLERHPDLGGATRQVIDVEDETGASHHFEGEALAIAHLPSWPNNIFIDTLYRWTDESGRTAYCTQQETWYHGFQQLLKGAR